MARALQAAGGDAPPMARAVCLPSQLGTPHPAQEELAPDGSGRLELVVVLLLLNLVVGEHVHEDRPEQGVVDTLVHAHLPAVLHLPVAAVGSTVHGIRSPVP